MIKSIIKKILFPNTYSSESYIKYLRNKGVTIGNGCFIWSPNKTVIDIQNGFLLEIGNYVKIAEGVKILNHDYSVSVARRKFHNHVGQAKKTIIGDNVFLGIDSIILAGSVIGNNTIVGAGSVVNGKFPDDVVIAGNPAKVICTLEKFYDSKKKKELNDARLFAEEFYQKNNRFPTAEEFGNAFAWLFLPRNKKTIDEYNCYFRLNGDNYNDIINDFMNSKASFDSYDEFLKEITKK